MPESSAYADWKAPSEDAQTLIWPEPPRLLADTQANSRLLQSADARIQNVALAEARQKMRQWIGHLDPNQPLIATGHQTELYHAGVWAKNVLMNSVARISGGDAYHIAVDTDSPKHLRIQAPGASEPLTDDPNEHTARWSGLVHPPTPAHLQMIASQFSATARQWTFEPLLPRFFGAMRRLLLEEVTISSAVANALHQLDWELGLRHHTLLASPLWQSEPFVLLLHHIAARADQFAADYNAALADYRREHRIRGNTRPMPDLSIRPDAVEIPFWLDELSTGRRQRAVVRSGHDGWQLRLDQENVFEFNASADGWTAAGTLLRWLRQRNIRLSPRAMTLTLFLRTLLADQFVHGIGGARYDQITDQLMARHFKMQPPKFCVTTATLYFPMAVGRSRACIPCLKEEGHQLKHRLLGKPKFEKIREIARLPRQSVERFEAFTAMRKQIDHTAVAHPSMTGWRDRFEIALRQSKEDLLMFDRELFYAVQSETRLKMMINEYDRALV